MPEGTSPPPSTVPDPALQKFREQVTARLAGGIVILFAVSLFVGLYSIGNPNFEQVKDIISILTPIVGVVLGYYFNKTSTEGRAEHAESTAQAASQLAQQATQDRNEAQIEAATMTESLHEVSAAAEQMLSAESYTAPGDVAAVPYGAAGDDTHGPMLTMTPERMRLEQALERARRVRTIRPRRQ